MCSISGHNWLLCVVNEDEDFKRDFDLLISIDGVGPITCASHLIDRAALIRFPRFL